ncbi:hypothetical protein HK104_003684, partial [Borealophlyctis nickersoniae]
MTTPTPAQRGAWDHPIVNHSIFFFNFIIEGTAALGNFLGYAFGWGYYVMFPQVGVGKGDELASLVAETCSV